MFFLLHIVFTYTNRVIKNEATLRNRFLPLGQFLNVVKFDIVHQWSIARIPDAVNNKAWSFEPEIGLADYTSAYQWILKRKDLLLVENKYFVPAGVETLISESEVKAFWKWRIFDSFVTKENIM